MCPGKEDKITGSRSAHKRRNGCYPNRSQEFSVKACPIGNEYAERKKCRPKQSQNATKYGRPLEPEDGNSCSDPACRKGGRKSEGKPPIPVHGRAFPAAGGVHPEIDLADGRMIGKQRPVLPLEERVQDRE